MRKKYSKVGEKWISKSGKEESKRTRNGYRKHKMGTFSKFWSREMGDKGMKKDRSGRNN